MNQSYYGNPSIKEIQLKHQLGANCTSTVMYYLKSKEDFINIIQTRKLNRQQLDRMKSNPIPITNETKQLLKELKKKLFKIKDKKMEEDIDNDEIQEDVDDDEIQEDVDDDKMSEDEIQEDLDDYYCPYYEF